MTIENNTNHYINLLKGTLIAIIISIILLLIFAAVLTYSNINENVIPTVIIIITAFSILIGSQISTSKIKKNGIINGSLVGATYIILIYLISSLFTKNFSLSYYSIIMIITGILLGGMGGILGVNRQ